MTTISYLQCTIRHNAHKEVATVRFLIKAKGSYEPHERYFVAVGAHRTGGDPQLVEFSCLDRAYDDVNAERLAKLRGNSVVPAEYSTTYEKEITQAVQNYFWLNERFVPATLEELVGSRSDLNLDDADTISSLNLSQCSGDTECDLRTEVAKKLLQEFDYAEPNEADYDDYNDALSELEGEMLNSTTTYRMLARKYPEQAEELRERHLAHWKAKTQELRDKFPSAPEED